MWQISTPGWCLCPIHLLCIVCEGLYFPDLVLHTWTWLSVPSPRINWTLFSPLLPCTCWRQWVTWRNPCHSHVPVCKSHVCKWSRWYAGDMWCCDVTFKDTVVSLVSSFSCLSSGCGDHCIQPGVLGWWPWLLSALGRLCRREGRAQEEHRHRTRISSVFSCEGQRTLLWGQ